MMTGYWISQAIYVAATLGLADYFSEGSCSSTELAVATGAHAPSLHRLLRALASVGIFTEAGPGHFALSPLAALLRANTPDSMRALAITYNEEQYRAWGDLLYSVQSGQPAFQHQFGMGPFEYFALHPEADRVFNEAMIGWTNQLADAVASTYDFSPFRTVVDVGGGYGTLLAAIVRRHRQMLGILFDLPHVVADAEEPLANAGVADRCTRIGGDFFAEVPPGGDAYLLAQILHDWDDERSVDILKQCRRAMPPHAKLLVIELVLPPGKEASFGKWLDLHMLVVTGGRERTAAEYDALFRPAGLALASVIPTPPGPSIVEAVPI
jgi:SAM-dependent methyltransferase